MKRLLSAISLVATGAFSAEAQPVFRQRGYYLCFMRMPTFGLAVWKEILDDAAADGAKELHAIAQWLVDQWTSENVALLNAL